MIKNLKTNEKILKLKKKFKISRIVIGTVAIFSAATIFLGGCGTKKETKNYTPSSSYSYNYSYNNSNYDNPLTKLDNYEYSPGSLNVTEGAYKEFINYIDNIDTVYKYEGLYNINSALNKYKSLENQKINNHNNSINNIGVESLFNSVKSNNNNYLEKKKKEYTADFYEEFSDDELRKICGIIIDTINYYINSQKAGGLEELKCVLGNLKIFKKTTLTNAYVTDDNALMVSPSMINTLKIKASSNGQDVFKDTICHEAIHMIQKGCEHTTSYYRIGNSFKFNDSNINPLFWKWFYEGSAEKLSNNFTKDNPLVYNYYVNYIKSLSFSKVLDNKVGITDLEETTLNNNLESIYSYFDAKSNKEKEEVIKMMFSIDIIETDNQEFLDQSKLDNNSDEYISTKRNLKTSVYETLTKYFYKSLAKKISDSNVKINDVFYLITVFESDMDSHLNYTDSEKYQDNKEFMIKYIDIQNNFFNYLSSNKKYTQEEIDKLFNQYGIFNSTKQNNYSLQFLSNDKFQFITNILDSYKINNTEQVKDSYSRNQGTNVKK